MRALAFETSCDDTCCALYDGRVLRNVVLGQVVHSKFGGVVPELASRSHLTNIIPALKSAWDFDSPLDVVAATAGPGLVGSLLVGFNAGQALALALERPFVGVNHVEGHVFSAFVEEPPDYPFLALVVSGGHTEMLVAEAPHDYTLLGRTLDDAAGEAFDKVAKMLGLGYPGGAALDALAEGGNARAFKFPVAVCEGLDFSYSGLKTAVLYKLRELGEEPPVADVAAAFREAAVRQLLDRLSRAVDETSIDRCVVVGGVSANALLRRELAAFDVSFPPPELCTDNAVMIAVAALSRLSHGFGGEERVASDLSLTPPR